MTIVVVTAVLNMKKMSIYAIVLRSWWETNQMNGTSESVMRVSTDAGETFGPLMMLGTNSTISSTEEEEAVGGEEVAQ
jgi:hypothetical protein